MSLTRYDGICFICGRQVKAGKGDFQSIGSLPKKVRNNIKGKWLVRGFECRNLGNIPQVGSPLYKTFNPNERT